MKKFVRPLLALSLATVFGLTMHVHAATVGQVVTPHAGYANDSYGSQLSFDSFHLSVRKRLESVRIGSVGQPLGRRTVAPDPYINNNYGPAPSYNYNNGGGYYNSPNSGGTGLNDGFNNNYNNNFNNNYGNNINSNYNNGNYNSGNYNSGNYNSGGTYNYNYGGAGNQIGAASFSSDEAYAMAPSSRVSSSSSYRRRQLDCVYYSGFTVWADLYQTWARQKSRGNNDGYRYRTFGPAIGVDWTSGPVTVGAAMTYNWGKLKSREWSNDRNIRTFAIDLYGQYNADLFYINGTLAYGHNSFRSSRTNYYNGNNGTTAGAKYNSKGDRYNSNSFNIDAEFGWKYNWSGLNVIPNIGLRYFHDRRGSINEGSSNYALRVGSRNYHVFEMPVGVNVNYEINTGGMIFVPRARFAWVPELARKKGSYSGSYSYVDAGDGLTYTSGISESAARRSRHGFQFALGMEAKITKALSAHLDYQCNFRSKLYEHHWNLGMGFTF